MQVVGEQCENGHVVSDRWGAFTGRLAEWLAVDGVMDLQLMA